MSRVDQQAAAHRTRQCHPTPFLPPPRSIRSSSGSSSGRRMNCPWRGALFVHLWFGDVAVMVPLVLSRGTASSSWVHSQDTHHFAIASSFLFPLREDTPSHSRFGRTLWIAVKWLSTSEAGSFVGTVVVRLQRGSVFGKGSMQSRDSGPERQRVRELPTACLWLAAGG